MEKTAVLKIHGNKSIVSDKQEIKKASRTQGLSLSYRSLKKDDDGVKYLKLDRNLNKSSVSTDVPVTKKPEVKQMVRSKPVNRKPKASGNIPVFPPEDFMHSLALVLEFLHNIFYNVLAVIAWCFRTLVIINDELIPFFLRNQF